MPNERAVAASQRPGKRCSIYVNVKPLVPKSTAKNSITAVSCIFFLVRLLGLLYLLILFDNWYTIDAILWVRVAGEVVYVCCKWEAETVSSPNERDRGR